MAEFFGNGKLSDRAGWGNINNIFYGTKETGVIKQACFSSLRHDLSTFMVAIPSCHDEEFTINALTKIWKRTGYGKALAKHVTLDEALSIALCKEDRNTRKHIDYVNLDFTGRDFHVTLQALKTIRWFREYNLTSCAGRLRRSGKEFLYSILQCVWGTGHGGTADGSLDTLRIFMSDDVAWASPPEIYTPNMRIIYGDAAVRAGVAHRPIRPLKFKEAIEMLNSKQPRVFVESGNFDIRQMFEKGGFRVSALIEDADIICLSGGADVDPSLYGMPNTASSISKEHDRMSKNLWDYAQKHRIPIVGICRGHQFIAVMNGLKLVQDNPQHMRNHLNDDDVICSDGSVLQTNSYHHQHVDNDSAQASLDCIVTARHADGTIEACSFPVTKSAGVQWHPEWLVPNSTGRTYFFALVQELLK